MRLSWFRWRIVFHDFVFFSHESGDSATDLVEFEALDDPGVVHTIEGLLVVDPGRGEVTALGSHRISSLQ